MKYLLDTHIFLWWNLGQGQLSERIIEIISNGNNEIFLSAASTWEITIKVAKKKLTIPEKPESFIRSRMQLHAFQALAIQIHHATGVYNLPTHHSDPFDRLLIAQSQIEAMPLLSADMNIRRYDLEVIW